MFLKPISKKLDKILYMYNIEKIRLKSITNDNNI